MHNLNPYSILPSGFLNRFESKEGSTIFTVMSILREGFQVVHNKGKFIIMCTILVNFQAPCRAFFSFFSACYIILVDPGKNQNLN